MLSPVEVAVADPAAERAVPAPGPVRRDGDLPAVVSLGVVNIPGEIMSAAIIRISSLTAVMPAANIRILSLTASVVYPRIYGNKREEFPNVYPPLHVFRRTGKP